MANLAQLVRASGCGSEGRGFETHSSPQMKTKPDYYGSFFIEKNDTIFEEEK